MRENNHKLIVLIVDLHVGDQFGFLFQYLSEPIRYRNRVAELHRFDEANTIIPSR